MAIMALALGTAVSDDDGSHHLVDSANRRVQETFRFQQQRTGARTRSWLARGHFNGRPVDARVGRHVELREGANDAA
jgi:hypothetical protein